MKTIYAVILGDLVGQPFEYNFDGSIPKKEDVVLYNQASRITDDSIMTIAACEYLIQKNKENSIEYFFKKHARENINCGFGSGFKKWITTPLGTVENSWGNGSIMRVAPFLIINDLKEMCNSINTSHSNILSLQAGLDLYKAYNDEKKREEFFQLNKFEKLEVRSDITFEIVYKIFNNTNSTHEAIKTAVSLGGDTDTNASIVAGLSNHHYNDITEEDIEYVNSKLTREQKEIIMNFEMKYRLHKKKGLRYR